jgi:tetratricopeptide (TPR) repeat protein
MNAEAIDWEQDLPLDADEAYRSLVRSLKRTDGFSLLFVCCSPVQGDHIITDVRSDLSAKNIEVLELKESIDNLYDRVAALPDRDHLNILFVKGIEYSIFAYEDREMNDRNIKDINLRSQSSGYGGTWKGIPRVLGHLNLSRERFRDNFKFCFVFLLPEFALRYFIRRAPDFFDWRSNVYEFLTEKELVHLDSYEEYCEKTPVQNITRLNEYEDAIATFDNAVRINPDDPSAWFSRGIALNNLGRYEEAIASYEKALQLDPDNRQTWYNIGNTLLITGNHKEALLYWKIAGCIEVLKLRPDDHDAWYKQGVALGNLVRDNEAISSFDKSLQIKPDFPEAWYNRGVALANLDRYDEAIASFDKALEINPDDYETWHNRGTVLGNFGSPKEAIASYDKALEIKPDLHEALIGQGTELAYLGRYEEAISSYNKATQLNPNLPQAWVGQFIVLLNLERYEEAIASLLQALQIKPDEDLLWDTIEILLPSMKEGFKSSGKVESIQIVIQAYKKGIKILEEIGDRERLLKFYYQLGKALFEFGNYTEAIKNLQVCEQISQELKDIPALALTLFDLARLYHLTGRLEQARLYFKDSLRLFTRLQEPEKIAAATLALGNLEMQIDKIPQALIHLKEAEDYYQVQNNSERLEEINYLLKILQVA